MKFLLLAAALFLCASCEQVIGQLNSLLDPDRLTWWRGKWSPAAVILSSNNKSANSVTVSFYFTPSTTISSGILEVAFPSAFGLTAVTGCSGQICQLGLSLAAGVDTTAAISGVTNPSATGLYSPFSLRTRMTAAGQTVDINLNFGSVYITAEAGMLGSLTVSLGGSASNSVINKSGNSLLFKFTISVSLWRYDSFIIAIDPRWTVGTTASCSSQDYAGRLNNFNGSVSSSPHMLNCAVSAKVQSVGQTVYIYGLAVDGIELAQTPDNQYVALLVGAVTTPDRVLAVNTYTWTVTTARFGTATALETGTIIGFPPVTADLIYSATWKPTWTLPYSSLIPGLSLYMDFSFPLANKIPAGGNIALTVTEDVASNTWASGNCYLVTKLIGAKCSAAAGGVVTVTSLPETSAGTFITIRTIAKMTTAAGGAVKATDLKTYDGSFNVIDAGTNLALFTMGSGASVATSLLVQLLKSDGTAPTIGANAAGGTGDSSGYLIVAIQPSDNTLIVPTSKVTIFCPISSTAEDFSMLVPTNLNHAGKLFAATPMDMTAGTTAIGSVTVSPGASGQLGSIDFPLPSALSSISAGSLLGTAHYPSAGASNIIAWPRVATNAATVYECRLEVADTASVKSPHRFVARVDVSPRPFSPATFQMPCLDGNPAVPGIFRLTPDLLELRTSTATANYYVEFEFIVNQSTASTRTGLSVPFARTGAIAYPHSCSAGSTTTATVYSDPAYSATDSAGKTTVLLTGLPEIRANNQLSVFFPLLFSAPSSNLDLKVCSSYVPIDDPRLSFVTYSSTIQLSGKPTTAATTVAMSTATVAPSSVTNSDSVSLVLTLGLSASPTNTVNPWIYIVLPPGSVWTADKSVRITNGAFDSAYFFSSPQASFLLPGVLLRATATSVISSTATHSEVTIGGMRVAVGAAPSASLVVVQGSTETAFCTAMGTIPLSVIAGSIAPVAISPSSIKARGTEGVDTKHTLSFLLTHGLPSTGSIRLTITADWKTTECGATCKATGLKDQSATKLVTCSVANNAAIVTSFAEFQGPLSVTLEISRLLPPGSPGTYNFLQSLATYTQGTGGLLVDQFTVNSSTEVTVAATSGPGSVLWSSKKTFPMNANAQRVDLYLRFSLAHALPRCGVLSLSVPMTWRLAPGDNRNVCFLSPTRYASCALSGVTLQVTMDADTAAGTYFELFLDSAVDNPGATTTSGFQIVATWYDVILDTDGATVQSAQKFTPGALLSSVLTMASSGVYFDPVTSGETANYVLNFTDSVAYSGSGDQYWVVFPQEFDPFLGDVTKWFATETNVYYIECSWPGTTQTWCWVDHGVVIATGKTDVAAGQAISLSIRGVTNPPAGLSSSFEVYHLNSNGDFLSVLQTAGKITTVAPSGKIDIRAVTATSSVLQQPSSYVFRFYVADSIETDSQIRVGFPREYDLTKVPNKDSYACSTTYRDQSSSQKLAVLSEWNQATVCSVSANSVILPPPKTATSFTSSQQISLTFYEVRNPQTATPRSVLSPNSDFDVSDQSLWPASAVWTGKFSLFLYKTSQRAVTLRSYPNLHAGYLGLTAKMRTLQVSTAAGGTASNRISVYSGTQSADFYITTESASAPCAAESLVFAPATNAKTPDSGRLKYTSVTDAFTITESHWKARFRVAAAVGMAKGLYLVDWEVKETPQTGGSEQYSGLPSTVVEVYPAKKGQFPVSVASIPNILVGYSSVPIKVSVANAPHTELVVDLAVQNSPPKLVISPSTLKFAPDVNELYFQVQVALDFSDTSSGSVLTLVLSLSGVDADVYSPPSSAKFSVSPSGITPPAGSISTWGVSSVTRTKVSFAPRVDQTGILYWHLAADGTAVPEFTALRTAVGSVFYAQNSTANASVPSAISANETWTQYQQRLLKTHKGMEWIGAVAIWDQNSAASLAVDWLWAGCQYQITGYLDNLNPFPIGVTAKTEKFVTASSAACQPFSLKFQGTVDSSLSASIAQLAALYQGVNPLRLFNPQYAVSFSRRLQSLQPYTTFTYTLVAERSIETSDPASQATISGSALTALKSALNSTLGISSSLYSVTNSAAVPSTAPVWTVAPRVAGVSPDTLVVELRSSVAGQTCCTAEKSSKLTPYAEQILLGLSADNQPTSSACISTNTTADSNQVTITGLTEKTVYYVYCAAGDNYPLWPTVMVYSTENPLLPLTFETAQRTVSGNSSGGTWVTATAAICLGVL